MTERGAAVGRTVARAARTERAGVAHPTVAWTSFDRYARYGAIAAALRANLGPGAHRVLDVGDSSGWLTGFDAELAVVNVDPTVDEHRFVDAVAVVGDGGRLPVRDQAVAAVVSSDALEHVVPAERAEFLRELARVTSDLLVVAAPFDTPGVAGVEEFVGRFLFAATNQPQPQLDEHRENGLPELGASVAVLAAEGFQVATAGNGNLHDWLLTMILKHQLSARPSLDFVDLGVDLLYNLLLGARNDEPPFYRHLIVARRATAVVMPERAPAAGTTDSTGLLGALTAASVLEGLRRDLVPGVERIEAQQQTSATHLMDRASGIEASLAHLMERFSGVEASLAALAESQGSVERQVAEISGHIAALRHPIAAVSRRMRPPAAG